MRSLVWPSSSRMVPVSEAGHPQPRREGVPQVLPAEFANAGPLQRRSEDETAPVERTASVRVREHPLARQARRQRAENGEELTLGRGSLEREHLMTLREPATATRPPDHEATA